MSSGLWMVMIDGVGFVKPYTHIYKIHICKMSMLYMWPGGEQETISPHQLGHLCSAWEHGCKGGNMCGGIYSWTIWHDWSYELVDVVTIINAQLEVTKLGLWHGTCGSRTQIKPPQSCLTLQLNNQMYLASGDAILDMGISRGPCKPH